MLVTWTKLRKSKALTLILSAPPALSIALLICLLSGVNGKTWTATVLNTLFLIAIVIHVSGYVFLVFNFSKKNLFVNFAFTVIFCLAFIGAAFGCFPGTGSRHSNCGAGSFVYFAVANVLALAIINRQFTSTLVTIFVLGFPVAVITSNWYLSAPLLTELKAHDLSKSCFIQEPVYVKDDSQMRRILSPSDLKLGLFIGENSPRVRYIVDNQIATWHYSKRQFGLIYNLKKTPKVCLPLEG